MIEVTNISKSYADILAVDRVSVQMRENTVFGLIGTNGAGKHRASDDSRRFKSG